MLSDYFQCIFKMVFVPIVLQFNQKISSDSFLYKFELLNGLSVAVKTD